MYIGIVLCVLIVFSLCRELVKQILVDEPLPEGILSQLVIRESLGQQIEVPKKSQLRFVGEDFAVLLLLLFLSLFCCLTL
jgi:hypothetical protein